MQICFDATSFIPAHKTTHDKQDSDVSPWPGLKACRWRPWPWPLRSRPWPWTVRPWPLRQLVLGLPWSWPYEALTVNYHEQSLVFLLYGIYSNGANPCKK